MNLKKTMAAGAAVLMCASPVLNVSAAETVSSKYLNALKGKEDLLLDVDAYKASYSDLEAAFGDDREAYIQHYLTCGIHEGRTKGVLFDPLAYADAYSDIKKTFDDDVLAIIDHYVTYGVQEERTAGTANGYADLAEAQEHGAYTSPVQTRQVSAVNSSAVNNSGSAAAAAVSSRQTAGTAASASSQTYHHTTSIYDDDEQTLLRVEYYDKENHLSQYSSVTNFDSSTNSYTEYIYYYDEDTQSEILQRTDTYENGVLVSSKSH